MERQNPATAAVNEFFRADERMKICARAGFGVDESVALFVGQDVVAAVDWLWANNHGGHGIEGSGLLVDDGVGVSKIGSVEEIWGNDRHDGFGGIGVIIRVVEDSAVLGGLVSQCETDDDDVDVGFAACFAAPGVPRIVRMPASKSTSADWRFRASLMRRPVTDNSPNRQ